MAELRIAEESGELVYDWQLFVDWQLSVIDEKRTSEREEAVGSKRLSNQRTGQCTEACSLTSTSLNKSKCLYIYTLLNEVSLNLVEITQCYFPTLFVVADHSYCSRY